MVTALLVAGVLPAQAVAATAPSQPVWPSTSSPEESVQQVDAPLERVVTLDLRDVRLEAALEEIDRQAHLGLAYTARVVPLDKRLTVKLDRVSAKRALEVVLKGTGVSVAITPTGSVMLQKPTPAKTTSARNQEGSLWGVVADSATTQPLEGSVVGVKGTSLSAVTNSAGAFLIAHVPAGVHTVTARHYGYMQADVEVAIVDSQSVHLDISLRMGMSRLQEVVTTATGSRRRLELGNDITVINADSIAATQPVTSVTDLLDGRVPGLVVEHSSGAPGDPARLRLRGSSSATLSNDPIVVLDGVRVYGANGNGANDFAGNRRSTNLASSGFAAPSPLDYLDPHSIEKIEVLKGPSAATMYGTDAANGVIVITTKKGRSGPPRWTASIARGTTYLPGTYPKSYLRWGHDPWNNATELCPINSPTYCIADSLVTFQALNDPKLTVLDHGNRTVTTLGVSGGSDALQYSVNGNYADELGLVQLPGLETDRYFAAHGVNPPDWMQRPERLKQWNATSRLTAKLGQKADVSLTTALTHSDQQRSSLENQLTSLMGTYVDRTTGLYLQPTASGTMQVANTLLSDYYSRVTDVATSFTNGMNMNWRPRNWLNANADVGLNVIQRDDELLLPNGAVLTTSDSVGRASSGRESSVMSTVNIRATATAPLPWGLTLETSVGANYTGQKTASLTANARSLAPGSSSIGSAGTILSLSNVLQELRTFGWYVEPTISHKRFWLSTGLRFDGGSTFGSSVAMPTFPKISASYLISDEPFFPFKSVFNTLRLRLAYGHSGVQPGPGDRLRLFNTPTSNWVDGRFGTVSTLSALGNTQLKPERSRELEGGFDTDLLDDRVSLGVTGYRKTRVDALLNVPLPPSIYGDGVSVLKNIGTIRNAGYELSLTTQLVRSDPVTWSMQAQFSHNENKVVSLGSGIDPFGLGSTARVVEGYPLFGRWGVPVIGYGDLNDDGILEANEVLRGDSSVYLGASEPDYTASLNTTLSLLRGKVAVSAGFAYTGGAAELGPWDKLRGVSRGLYDPTAPLSEQAASLQSGGGLSSASFLNMQTVSTLRFNSLSVAYNIPTSMAQRFRARTMSVALQGTNLGLHTNYRGLDPDVGYGTDAGQVPQPRTWQVRVNATY